MHDQKRVQERYGIELTAADIRRLAEALQRRSFGGLVLVRKVRRKEWWSIDPVFFGRTGEPMYCLFDREAGAVVTFLPRDYFEAEKGRWHP